MLFLSLGPVYFADIRVEDFLNDAEVWLLLVAILQ